MATSWLMREPYDATIPPGSLTDACRVHAPSGFWEPTGWSVPSLTTTTEDVSPARRPGLVVPRVRTRSVATRHRE